mmetsp:Transcript_9642/g.36202  ORF Transcript_9642/g.36202 Transcript_9642/m.36202 type:complete len:227 (+) Transcript_9642:144-824(+)
MDFPDAPKEPPNAAAIQKARLAKMTLQERLEALKGPRVAISAEEKDTGNLETRLRQLRGLPTSAPKDSAARDLEAQLMRIEPGGAASATTDLDADMLVHQMLHEEEQLGGSYLSSEVGDLRASMEQVAGAVKEDDDLSPARAKPLPKPKVARDEIDVLMQEAKSALAEGKGGGGEGGGGEGEGEGKGANGGGEGDGDEDETQDPDNVSDEEVNRVMQQFLDEAKIR